jgi:hypothetical protein
MTWSSPSDLLMTMPQAGHCMCETPFNPGVLNQVFLPSVPSLSWQIVEFHTAGVIK